MAKDIPTSNNWLQSEQETMTKILRSKFQQNPDLASILINTGQKSLHEATSDRKWSTGAELASRALLNSDWHGQSIMGQLLQSVRNELSAEQPISDQTPLPSTEGLDVYEDITPLPVDTTISTPPLKQSQPSLASTPLPGTVEPQPLLLENNTLDLYHNTGARPKSSAEKNITSRRPSQSKVRRSPTPPPRTSRQTRTKKSSQGGIINC